MTIQQLLRASHVRVPEVLAAAHKERWLLLGDLGCQFADVQERSGAGPIPPGDAWALLQRIHSAGRGASASRAVAEKLRAELLAVRHALPRRRLGGSLATRCLPVFDEIVRAILQAPTVLVHGDFHARNILVDEQHRLGIIDFQDAFVGPGVIDVVAFAADHNFCRSEPELRALIQGWSELRIPDGVLDTEIVEAALVYWHLRLLGRLAYLNSIRASRQLGRERRVVRHYLSLMVHVPSLPSRWRRVISDLLDADEAARLGAEPQTDLERQIPDDYA